MKSAYELAMEKLGGSREYTDEQKARLAEIDSRYEAKRAESELAARERLKTAAPGSEDEARVRYELAQDIERLNRKQDAEKQKIRDEV